MFLRFTALAVTLGVSVAGADEGMWLFNKLPEKTLKQKHNFETTKHFTEHLMRSSVRVSYGGSGSFVSADGLVLTNHHVASQAIDTLGKKDKKNYMEEGFVAKNLSQEKNPNDGLEIEALVKITDVTAEVQKAVKLAKTPAEQNKARKKAIAEITSKAEKDSGLKCEVVTLYQGGQYHLYQYKIYTDVRLVFAPEKDVAFFGGDPDNFEFPRYNLDMALFRVYENGKPAQTPNYLKLPTAALKEGDLVFVSGNPGTTQRLLTSAALEFVRDYQLPATMDVLWRLESLYVNYIQRGTAEKQKLEDDYFSVANSRKARRAQLLGLQDPKIMNELKAKEDHLIQEFKKRGETKALAAYAKIAKSRERLKEIQIPFNLLENAHGFNSMLFSYARRLVRASAELQKPDGDRLEEYNQAKLKTLELKVTADEPTYQDVEILKLADSLSYLQARIQRDPKLKAKYGAWLAKVFKGMGPTELAKELITKTSLADVGVRKNMFKMKWAEMQNATDPLIQFAMSVDGEARAVRKIFEEEVREVERQAYDDIAQARFRVLGDGVYPDATFSPRVAFGTIKGWNSFGKYVPPFTTIAGLYEREAAQKGVPPFNIPPQWKNKKSNLNLSTPFNFVSTADIIGGNSGSPTVNAKGELVGLIFDGNIESLIGDYVYDESVNRAVSVDVRGMVHALDKMYQAQHILSSFGVDNGNLPKLATEN